MGLNPGATSDDIHAAFRKLARELHPDVTGQKSNHRFQQVTGAYTLLKTLAPEELESFAQNLPEHERLKAERAEQKRRAEEEREKLTAKIDGILSQYESAFNDYATNRKTGDDSDMNALILRLGSNRPGVINAALKRSAPFANRAAFRKALTGILTRPEIDSGTADIISALPFDGTTRKLIALDTANNAWNFPAGLIISLIGDNPDAMESMLLHAAPENAAVILRRWPAGKAMNAGVLRTLLASDDARILVPLLGTIRENFPASARQHRKRLTELEGHSSAAVRAWARKLL